MEIRGGVLVGIGDEYEAMPELDWGGREAVARSVALQLVRAYHRSLLSHPWSAEDLPSVAELRADALQRLQRALAHANRQWPGLTVRADIEEGLPADVLIAASGSADVTVLGSRHLGPIGGLLLGSVSNAVALHARGPVVVVRNAARVPVVRPAVVVGLYGVSAEAVLRFGFDHAARHGEGLEAVVCVTEPYEHRLNGESATELATVLADRAGRWLSDTVAPWHRRYPDVEVRETVTVAQPVAGLVEASAGQELLVVGGRPRDRGMPLGSVTQGVLHHAECPVAVVPAARPGVRTSSRPPAASRSSGRAAG